MRFLGRVWVLLCAVGFAAMALLGSSLTLLNGVIMHSPLKPDAAAGLIYPYNNHGVIHYVGYWPHILNTAFGWAGAIFAVPIIITAVMYKAWSEGKGRG